MAIGRLRVQLTDLVGAPVGGEVLFKLKRFSGEPGTGGDEVTATAPDGVMDLTIKDIPCRGGIGTMYEVFAFADHYRTFGFQQKILEDTVMSAADDVEFWVKPGDVRDILAPLFQNLPDTARGILDNANMVAPRDEDRDLVGLAGTGLYAQLGPLRMACLLNIIAKASDGNTADNCIQFIDGLMLCRQDRFFVQVQDGMPAFLNDSERYKSADGVLHDPLSGFRMTGESFKSRDSHANLQVTFMQHIETGQLVADVDIDESAGIKHGLEVIRNAVFKNRTNPFLIREFMLAADQMTHRLNPGYRFKF